MDRKSINRGIGCLTILPTAMIGFAGLNDGIGPTGWRGFAEMFGWFVTCLVTARLFALLLRRSSRVGTCAVIAALVAVAGGGALAYELVSWLCLDAPMSAKNAFTYSMQAFGAVGAVFCSILLANAVWKEKRHYELLLVPWTPR